MFYKKTDNILKNCEEKVFTPNFTVSYFDKISLFIKPSYSGNFTVESGNI